MNLPLPTPLDIEGSVQLTDWGVIRATGVDAATFLQGQLTNDVLALAPLQARLAGFCSAKGRLQASFVVWRVSADEFMLACSASLLAATLKRLSMFVLRAKCKLADATSECPLFGVTGAGSTRLIGDLAVWLGREGGGQTLIRVPDAAGQWRAICTGHGDSLARLIEAPDASDAACSPTLADWRWLELQTGIATIEAATVDRFVPQMLNFEIVGGVDFAKGCYPGQEVVARSQYRGTIKRRMALFDCDTLPLAGQDVFHSDDASQPAGTVANAAPRPGGAGASALIEVRLADLDHGSHRLGTPDGPLLARRELPYRIDAESPALA
jgi:folate-binding protein YgfZ